jgi:DNA-binding XRE family transcriptional regulator/quercetin dioxygenase-like cupin family protein
MCAEMQSGPAGPLATNLRRWREQRGLSLSALARASNVAKSTISEIERGLANPSLETLWSLVQALNIPFAALFSQPDELDPVQVVRGVEAPVIGSVAGVFASRHMLSRYDGGDYEVYSIELDAGAVRAAIPAHAPGTLEHVFVAQGRVAVGPDKQPVELGEGDLVTFPGDQVHRYESLAGPARLVVIQEYPARPAAG